MSKIGKEASDALVARRNYKLSNTEVDVRESGEAVLCLYDNVIARYDGVVLQVRFAGRATRTTCDRLNALPNVEAKVKAGNAIINGQIVSEYDWITI